MIILKAARVAVVLVLAPMAALAADTVTLLMVEQPGCIYCARWDEEIGPKYPLTPEGKSAPLARMQLRGPLPDGVSVVSRPVFTPTFILLRDNAEVGRIEGYPGEDFFWGLLGLMLDKAEVARASD